MAAERAERTAPRGFWSGTISFGLVSVPVDLYPAVRSFRPALRMLGPEGQPLQRRYVCSEDGKELSSDEIVRGYEWDDGSFTVVEDEELEALAPRKSRDIDLRRFVPRAEIPRELLERPYVLAPAGESTKAYHLLAETMERSDRAGIATFVMRGKEYLAAIYSEGGLLRAATMRFIDELRKPEDVGLPRPGKVSAAARKRVESALAKLEKKDLDPKTLEDEASEALLQLAKRKLSRGKDVVEIEEMPEEEEDESAEVIDIMAVLKQRVEGGRRGSTRRASSSSSSKQRSGRSRHPSGLERKSKKELYERAKKLDLPNRSKLSRDQLIAAIRKAG